MKLGCSQTVQWTLIKSCRLQRVETLTFPSDLLSLCAWARCCVLSAPGYLVLLLCPAERGYCLFSAFSLTALYWAAYISYAMYPCYGWGQVYKLPVAVRGVILMLCIYFPLCFSEWTLTFKAWDRCKQLVSSCSRGWNLINQCRFESSQLRSKMTEAFQSWIFLKTGSVHLVRRLTWA